MKTGNPADPSHAAPAPPPLRRLARAAGDGSVDEEELLLARLDSGVYTLQQVRPWLTILPLACARVGWDGGREVERPGWGRGATFF